jgi:hypothetical protein
MRLTRILEVEPVEMCDPHHTRARSDAIGNIVDGRGARTGRR